jgi:hypothetical protein
MNPIQSVSAPLTSYSPSFQNADYSQVQRWLDAGCDLEQDILPVIREWTARKPDIYSLGFFTKYVLIAKAKREHPVKPVDPHRKAKHLAYLIRVVGRCMPTDQRWLDAYEREHGPVAPLQLGSGLSSRSAEVLERTAE